MVQLLHLADEEAEAQGWRQDGGREMSCSWSLVQGLEARCAGSQAWFFPWLHAAQAEKLQLLTVPITAKHAQ